MTTEFDEKKLLFLAKLNQGLVLTNSPVDLITESQADNENLKLNDINVLLPKTSAEKLGSASFRHDYKLNFSYMAGAMANGIHSAKMVIALANAGMLGSFGAGGLTLNQVEAAIREIQSHTSRTFSVNLLHNPADPAWEMGIVEACIKHQVSVIEASAYIRLSPAIVYYRIKGIQKNNGEIIANHKIIAKVSRPEVATHFMSPPPIKTIKKLIKSGLISTEEAELASNIPMADDITIEANSGGHTDGGTLICIFPEIQRLGNQHIEKYQYKKPFRFGAAGGIGCPESITAALQLGADYIVTGSINQACIESGTSDAVKAMLCQATTADTMNAPSADMFELGAQVQILSKGSMYGVRAQKLYELYKQLDKIEKIPEDEKRNIEKTIFRQDFDQVWQDTVKFFEDRELGHVIEQANSNFKKKTALCFQWYLGQSSKWAIEGNLQRRVDYQIWCGPAMGSCNQWLSSTPLAKPEARHVVTIGMFLMKCAAYLQRVNTLRYADILIKQPLTPTIMSSLLNTE
jgi:PfaD family protein